MCYKEGSCRCLFPSEWDFPRIEVWLAKAITLMLNAVSANTLSDSAVAEDSLDTSHYAQAGL